MTEQKHRHRGFDGGRARYHPKGRQVDPAVRDEIRSLLGKGARERQFLIEHLHAIQDRYGCLPLTHLAALAEEMALAMSEVYETATFYAHFDVLKDGEPPPEVTVRVCDSLTCEMMGAKALFKALRDGADPTRIRVTRAPCMGRCAAAPVVQAGRVHIEYATVNSVRAVANRGRFAPALPDYRELAPYEAGGGYRLLRACLRGARDMESIITLLDQSGLPGLGGAGFPMGRKWRLVRAHRGPRLMVVNADEGEPGTFKDRHYLECDPHRVLEGMLIAAWAVEAECVYFYLRNEYPGIREMLLGEIPKLEAAGYAAHTRIVLRRGAGAYICGEESAMIESIEGKRGLPRHRPPYVAEVGLFGRPTLVQNVETLYWIRDIVERGPAWYLGHGRHGGKGLRSYSVSGRVRTPGVKRAPAGITVRELIAEYCGGMQAGHRFTAYLPGGASGGILPASLGDLPLDFGTLEKYGCFVGSHAVIVLSQDDDIKGVALNLMRFFEDESCGQCTPCRVGTEKAVKLMDKQGWDEPLLGELGRAMSDASICGLGQAAAHPIESVLRHFRGVLE